MEKNGEYLCYVRPIGKNSDDLYEYEFFFTEKPDIVWGQDWNEQCPSACGDITPDPSTYNQIERLCSKTLFSCAQENSCFSMQDCIDGCVAICYESLQDLEEYPEPFRFVFQFGQSKEEVVELLAKRNEYFDSDTEHKVSEKETLEVEDEEETDDEDGDVDEIF